MVGILLLLMVVKALGLTTKMGLGLTTKMGLGLGLVVVAVWVDLVLGHLNEHQVFSVVHFCRLSSVGSLALSLALSFHSAVARSAQRLHPNPSSSSKGSHGSASPNDLGILQPVACLQGNRRYRRTCLVL